MGIAYEELKKNPKRPPKQFPVRLDADLYDWFKLYSEKCRSSMNEIVSILIQAEIERVNERYGSIENMPYLPDPESDGIENENQEKKSGKARKARKKSTKGKPQNEEKSKTEVAKKESDPEKKDDKQKQDTT
jgi:hypothetical protein